MPKHMYRTVVNDYIKEELRKGKELSQIRKKLLSVGYSQNDVSQVIRTFEYKQADIANKTKKLHTIRRNVLALSAVVLVILIINGAMFISQVVNPQYVVLKETPTGLVATPITKQELGKLQHNTTAHKEQGPFS